MPTYQESEAVSYGLGDIHLPLGWGDIPLNKVFDGISLPKNANLNFELLPKHHAHFEESIKIARELNQKI